ncbi:ECF RNA polymerase sigma factor SigE [compost metagenome]
MPDFEYIYKQHFESLYRYAFTIVKDSALAQDITQDVFLNYYHVCIQQGNEVQNARAYLYRSIHNHALKQIRNSSRQETLGRNFSAQQQSTPNKEEELIDQHTRIEFYRMANEILDSLPPQCRIVFEKSRMEHKKYEEIAEELHISTKTVEGHISKALKLIRSFLQGQPQSTITTMLFILFICRK